MCYFLYTVLGNNSRSLAAYNGAKIFFVGSWVFELSLKMESTISSEFEHVDRLCSL